MGRQLSDLHPIVSGKATKLLEIAIKEGITLTITSTYRNQEEQDALYAKGRTTAGNIVTNAKFPYSFHNHRVAFDVVPIINGQTVWGDYTLWNRIGALGKSLGLEWGGDWASFPDRPHFQYTQGLSLTDFINGKTLQPESVNNLSGERLDVVSDWAKLSWDKAKVKNIVGLNTLPQSSVTKEELVVFFDRAGLLNKINESLVTNIPVNISQVSGWALSSWKKAIEKAVVNENTHPQDRVTKEELMVFFDRAGII